MALFIITLILIFISLLLSILNLLSQKTAMEIVNDMGIGYNLGYSFDSCVKDEYGSCMDESLVSDEIKNPDDQILLLGNPIPTKKMIKNIKKNGFKTIRFPVTWMYFMDDFGKINPEWMSRVKEVVSWINEYNMYCILNVYNDGSSSNWLSNGINSKEKYVYLWKQIAEEFKDYNEYLIFENMDSVQFFIQDFFTYTFDYSTFYNFSQAFIDTVRNSGGNNKERLLIISGPVSDLELTTTQSFLLPTDPSNKYAISIHYFIPSPFTTTGFDSLWMVYRDRWGNDTDYSELITNFEILKNIFINKNIPIILSEVGVKTEEKKRLESIREFLYVVFSMSVENDGFMACLWDSSNKKYGDMNFYNRETNEWYDEKLKENFLEISKGKNIKTYDYYIMTTNQTISTPDNYGNLNIKFGQKKALTIILNVKLYGELFVDLSFYIQCIDINGKWIDIEYGKKNSKKQYDGTQIFTIDVKDKDCYQTIDISKWDGEELIIFNNLTVVFQEKFNSFDCNSYKSVISEKVN